MKINLKINDHELQKTMKTALEDLSRTYEQGFKDLLKSYTGKPVAEIKPAIQQMFRSHDGSISEPELTNYAKLISEGKEIRMIVK